MYFSGSNVSVILSAPPQLTLPMKTKINELFIMPITKWRVVLLDNTISYYDPVFKRVLTVGSVDPVDSLMFLKEKYDVTLGGVAINNTDLNAFNMWAKSVQDKYRYRQIYETLELNTVAIQFSNEQPSVPLFTPGSSISSAYMRGTTMVQGTLALNMDTQLDIDFIGAEYGLNLFIDYSKESIEKSGAYRSGDYTAQYSSAQYAITDVHFMSKSHTVTPSADNTIENLQFIGKLLLDTTT